MRFDPLPLLRPNRHCAAQFAAPPYDVFDRSEARQFVTQHPGSFLEIDRPEVHFSKDHDMYASEVYTQAALQLKQCIQNNTLTRDTRPAYYIYRQVTPVHTQLGIVGGFPVDTYGNTVRRHEKIRPDKLQDRIQHIRACKAQTGPVYLACRDASHKLSHKLHELCACEETLYDFMSIDGVQTTVWRVSTPSDEAELAAILKEEPAAYIADGHHRCAAAVDVARQLHNQYPHASLPEASRVLSVLFPADELSCFSYHRVVYDVAGHTPASFIDALRSCNIEVYAHQGQVQPKQRHSFGMYVDGNWYTLRLDAPESSGDPVAQLDTQLLQTQVLQPLLHVDDPTKSSRISFVGGVRGLAELERRAGSSGVAFSLYPTSIDQMMDVADTNTLMPPKSTWFEPKLLSGLFIHLIDAPDSSGNAPDISGSTPNGSAMLEETIPE